MIMDFYLGGALQTTFTSSTYSTCDRKYFQMTGGTFDRVDIQASTAAGNWVITELEIQLLAGLFPNFTSNTQAGNAPLAVPGIKRTINYRAEQGLQEAMQFEAASASVLFTSDDMTLGYKAMAAKEDANFEGT